MLVLSGFLQVPIIVLAETTEELTREVATEAEFNAALADTSVEVIQLNAQITLSKSQDGNDNAFVIGRPVTITGGGLSLERAGIVLGGNVTLENITLAFNVSARNAIIANGYALTLNNVSGTGTYAINYFATELRTIPVEMRRKFRKQVQMAALR